MAKINLPPRKPKSYTRKVTDKRKMRQKAYNSADWKKVRLHKLMTDPICQMCNKRPATQVHHIISPFQDNRVDYDLFLNEKNLLSICPECHGNLHSGKQKLPEDIEVTPEEELELDLEII